MNYPFEFRELLLTSYVLDQLGFSEYHDGAGDFGYRSINLGTLPYFVLIEMDPKRDLNDGYGEEKIISGGYYLKDWVAIYFLHDLFECMIDSYGVDSEQVKNFTEKCKKENCYPYLKSYLEYKEIE